MKYAKYLYITALLLCISLFGFQRTIAQNTEGPRIELIENSYDFGTIGRDSVVYHIFKFKNTGSDTLRIHKVKSS